MSDKVNYGKDGCGASGNNSACSDANSRDERALKENMDRIRHKIVVLSGKGGVGKSTVAVNLSSALAARKFRTGLLDVDIHGPSVPKLLGIEDQKVAGFENGSILPVDYNEYLRVISVGFMLSNRDAAVVWRGPLKYGLIKQFLQDTLWGDLDFMVVDSPPGTGDEPLSVCQLIGNPDGAIIVTTPQDVALADVRKSVTFCRQMGMTIIGVVENMSGFICPHCGTRTDIFKTGGGLAMSEEMGIPFLGSIPVESQIVASGDNGYPFNNRADCGTPAQKSFMSIVDRIVNQLNGG